MFSNYEYPINEHKSAEKNWIIMIFLFIQPQNIGDLKLDTYWRITHKKELQRSNELYACMTKERIIYRDLL